MQTDGSKKNDCERNAAKRLLPQIRREHPHLKLLILADGLVSSSLHIQLLQQLNMRYILGAKPDDHGFLFDWVASMPGTRTMESVDIDRIKYQFRYYNRAPLNEPHNDWKVNLLECWETDPDGNKRYFSWVTEREIARQDVAAIMQVGRASWKVENETFNTLKNQGHHFEYNSGLGKKHLAMVFANLMMLTFLIDQVQAMCCQLFRAAHDKEGRPGYFLRKVRSRFDEWLLPDG